MRKMFITDHWYVCGWTAEIGTTPMRRVILNVPIVLFRQEDGAIGALEDRCPHRNFPLSKSYFTGGTFQCGYHGLTFDSAGKCVYAPGESRVLPIAIRSFSIVERYGAAWIWMDDKEKADPTTIPNLSWLDQPGWTSFCGGYFHVKAPDQSIDENLLDISHIAYVHRDSIGSDADLIAAGKTEVIPEPYGLRRLVDHDAIPTPPIYARSSLVGDRVDQRVESWKEIGLYQNFAVVKPADSGPWQGPGAEGDYPIKARSFHAIVPETEHSSHYFYGGASKDVDVPLVSAASSKAVFGEDIDVLESIEDNMQYFADSRVVNLRNDSAVMRWRSFRKKRMNEIDNADVAA